MRNIFLILILLLSFTFIGAAAELPPDLRNLHRIVTLGDSITQGGGEPGGYVWLLQHYLSTLYPEQKIEVINAGMSGHKSTDMQARFQRDVLDRKPDLVTINVGINDVWHAFRDFQNKRDYPKGNLPAGVPLELYRQKVQEMISAAKQAGVIVVLVSPTVIHENPESPENARLAGYLRAMADLARQNKCKFIDLNTPFRNVIRAYQKETGGSSDVNLLTKDGVHMNPAGNLLMAHTILRGLGVPEKDLAISQAP